VLIHLHLVSRLCGLVCSCCSAMGAKRRRAAVPWEESQERSDRIDRRMENLLVQGLRCFSQAFLQTERQIDNKKWLRKFELKEIQEKCEDECCDPNAYEPHWYEAQKLEYERERLAKEDKHEERRRVPFDNYYEPGIEWTAFSSSSATSSTNLLLQSTEHSLVRAATEHSLVRQAACQEAKRPRKNGKGTSAHARTKSPDPLLQRIATAHCLQACEHWALLQSMRLANTEPLLQSMACMFEEKERNASCERRSMNTATEHEYARTEHCYRAYVINYFS
jgi:hypothetical protein